MKWSWLPNAISLFRVVLVVPCVCALLVGRYDLTLAGFGVAAVSDALDGWLAKTFGWASRLGKILDPVADKLLLVSFYLTLSFLGRVPPWLTATVVLRDAVIVLGAAAYRLCVGYLEGHPTAVSKLNTLLQLLFVLLVIARAQWPLAIPATVEHGLGACVFGTTVVSGLDYVLTYAREAVRAIKAKA